jgi:rhomboid family GlyGly-CTERM serine protease
MKSPIVCLAIFVSLTGLLAFLGPWLNPLLAWNRYDIEDFQWWRLFTGHLMHTNLWHACINLSVLSAAAAIFGKAYKPQSWLLIFLILSLTNSIALFLFTPWLANYVGLSGVLYGILAVGFLSTFYKSPVLNAVVLICITAKIIYEQMPGFDVNYLRTQIEAAVIVDAHLYGLITGIVIYTAMLAWKSLSLERKQH